MTSHHARISNFVEELGTRRDYTARTALTISVTATPDQRTR